MRFRSFLITLSIAVTVLSCNRSATFEGGDPEGPMLTKATSPSSEEVERKLIKEGSIEFETPSIASARKVIAQAVTQYKGYISSDQELNQQGKVTNTLVIRIPTSDFDSFLKDATAGVEKFDRKEIELKDVTEDFLDVQARLNTKKELEARYLDLLKQTKSVTEILEVEKELGTLRADIESIEGRFKYLQNRVSLSIITLTIYESIRGQSAFGQKIKHGFGNGWDALLEFFVVLVNLWAFIVSGALAFFLVRRFKTKRKKNETPV